MRKRDNVAIRGRFKHCCVASEDVGVLCGDRCGSSVDGAPSKQAILWNLSLLWELFWPLWFLKSFGMILSSVSQRDSLRGLDTQRQRSSSGDSSRLTLKDKFGFDWLLRLLHRFSVWCEAHSSRRLQIWQVRWPVTHDVMFTAASTFYSCSSTENDPP